MAVAERVFAVQGQDPIGLPARRARPDDGRHRGRRGPCAHRGPVARRSRGSTAARCTWSAARTIRSSRRSRRRRSGRAASAGSPRRAFRRGMSSAGIETIERSLADEGPLTSDALRERIAATGVRAEGQALYHLLFQASLRGLIVRGPDGGEEAGLRARPRLAARREAAWTATRRSASSRAATSWATGRPPTATSRAGPASRCATRAPASPRRGSATAAGGTPSFRRRGSSAASSRACSAGRRARTSSATNSPNLVTVGGMFYPFAMVRGRAVARWKLRDGGLELEPVPADLEGGPRRARARRRGREALPRLASRAWSSPSTPPATATSGTGTRPNWVEHARRCWASDTPWWGGWEVPEEEVRILPDVSGLDVVDLGCGTGYWCAWFMRLGARPVGPRRLGEPARHGTRAAAGARARVPADPRERRGPAAAGLLVRPRLLGVRRRHLVRPVRLDPARAPAAAAGRAADLPLPLDRSTRSAAREEGASAETLQRPQRGLERIDWPDGDRLPPGSRRANRAAPGHGLRDRGAPRALRAGRSRRGGPPLRESWLGAEVAQRGGLGGAAKER